MAIQHTTIFVVCLMAVVLAVDGAPTLPPGLQVNPNATVNTQWCSRAPTIQMKPYRARSFNTEQLSKEVTNFTLVVDSVSNLFITSIEQSGNIQVEGASLNSVVFQNLTHTYVALEAGEDGLQLFSPHTVTVKILPGAFMCSNLVASGSATYTYKKTESLVDPEQVEATTAVAATAGAVSGVASSSTLATQTARAAMVLSLTQCKFSHNTQVDSQASPTGYRFGSATGGYYRGGIVGNLILMLGIAILMLIIGVLVFLAWKPFRSQGPKVGMRLAFERVHFPGMLVVPFATLLPGTAMCAMALALHGADGASDIVLSCLTFLYLIAVIGFFGFRLTKGFSADWIPDSVEYDNGKTLEGMQLPLWHRCFHGSMKWTDSGSNFKNAYGTLFADYREKFGWFITVELGVTVLSGILDGIRPTTGGCLGVGIGVLVCNFIITIPAIFVRPCATIYNTSHFILNTGLTLISSILLVVSQVGSGNDKMALATTWISTVCIYLAFVKAAIDALLAIQKVYWAVKDYARKQRRKGKDTDTAKDQKEDVPLVQLGAQDKTPLVGDGKNGAKKGGTGDDDSDFDDGGGKAGHAQFKNFSIDEGDQTLWETRDDKEKEEEEDIFCDGPGQERKLAPMAAAKYSNPNNAQKDIKLQGLASDGPVAAVAAAVRRVAPSSSPQSIPLKQPVIRLSNRELLEEDEHADLL